MCVRVAISVVHILHFTRLWSHCSVPHLIMKTGKCVFLIQAAHTITSQTSVLLSFHISKPNNVAAMETAAKPVVLISGRVPVCLFPLISQRSWSMFTSQRERDRSRNSTGEALCHKVQLQKQEVKLGSKMEGRERMRISKQICKSHYTVNM